VLKLSLPARLVPPLATLKLALGMIAFAATWERAPRNPAFPYSYYALFSLAFGLTGALLLLGGRGDRRAIALGGFFLSTATSWCNTPLRTLAESGPGYGLFSLVDALELDAFLPWFLWVFVRDFPSPPPASPTRRVLQLGVRLSGVAGLALFGLNLLAFLVRPVAPRLTGALAVLSPDHPRWIFYTVTLSLTTAAFLFLPWKAYLAQGAEQRRARVFLQLLGFTFGPMLVFLVIDMLVPGCDDFLQARPRLMLGLVTAVMVPGLTLPLTVPYAVLVHRVLDVRLIARRALQHTLARSLARGLAAVPAAALAAYVYLHRKDSFAELCSGPRMPLLLSAVLVGWAALRYRRPLLEAVDRRFFREQYDARQILSLLVERVRSIRDSTSLADLICREVDLALHLERISLLALDARLGLLVDPHNRTRRLDPSSPLVLALSGEPLEVDLDSPPLLKLPEKDRQCLAESGFRLLVPILARDGTLLGLVSLGDKKSGLPFLKEDRQLLHAIASNAAWVLELEQESAQPSRRSWREAMEPDDPTPRELPTPAVETAKECPKCGALHPSYTVFCSACSRRLESSVIPYILPGRFRFERRIGTGGMGVVYSGSDLALGRRVAIKTLRQVSSEDAMRLRREARTAAAVSHPHLAPIYGLETWQGTPLLVLELLEGGTLAQRIAREKLTPRETVDLGCAMAGALAELHAADIIHRDIKPSNIGYTRDRVPKLMDFGIARVMLDLAAEDADADLDEPEDDEEDAALAALWARGGGAHLPVRLRFAGTLSYLAPEVLRGDCEEPAFDLWSLAIVLYECLLGRKVFAGTSQQVIERIRSGAVPDFSQIYPDHDETLGAFFRAALHRSPSRRPASAEEMRERLEEVRETLGAEP
jgi:hypothetical protein